MPVFSKLAMQKNKDNNETVLQRDTVHQISRGRSGGPYHVITQFYFYPVISKQQNSINIYPWS